MQRPWKNRLNLLASYYFLRKDPAFLQLVVQSSPYVNWLIDCGAFTNFQARQKRAVGKTVGDLDITLPEYLGACQQHFHGRVWQYMMLDVIKDAAASERNWNEMLQAGLLPMPVYVEGWETPERMQQLCAINPRICIAGGVRANDHWIRKRYLDAYAQSGQRALIHALGFGRFPDVFQLPIASCDSSSLARGGRFGEMLRYSRVTGFTILTKKDLSGTDDRANAVKRREFLRWLLDDCNVSIKELTDKEHHSHSTNIPLLTHVYGYLQFSQHCQDRNLDYFIANSFQHVFSNMIGLLAHSNAAAFDYKLSRAHTLHLLQLQRAAPQKWIDESIEIIKQYTSCTESADIIL